MWQVMSERARPRNGLAWRVAAQRLRGGASKRTVDEEKQDEHEHMHILFVVPK